MWWVGCLRGRRGAQAVLRATDDHANSAYVTRLLPWSFASLMSTVALPPPWAAVRCTRQGDQFIPSAITGISRTEEGTPQWGLNRLRA